MRRGRLFAHGLCTRGAGRGGRVDSSGLGLFNDDCPGPIGRVDVMDLERLSSKLEGVSPHGYLSREHLCQRMRLWII